MATDSPALSFDLSAWMVDVNCKSVGPNDAWTKVPCHHPTSYSIVHSPSVTTVETSNLFLPLYSLMAEDCDDEDEDPTESPTVSPSCSNESTKPDPPFTVTTHCIPKKFKKTQKKSMSKSTKSTSTSSPSTKPTSAYTLYGIQDKDCPTRWNNHFKKCLVPAMNKQFKKNGINMLKSVSKRSTMLTPCTNSGPCGHVFKISQRTPHPLYPNHGRT